MNDFFANWYELISYFEGSDERTMICFFGHVSKQPLCSYRLLHVIDSHCGSNNLLLCSEFAKVQ